MVDAFVTHISNPLLSLFKILTSIIFWGKIFIGHICNVKFPMFQIYLIKCAYEKEQYYNLFTLHGILGMPFIIRNKVPLRVAVQSPPSFKISKIKFDSFIKQWQHLEPVTSRLGAEGRGTKRAKTITQPSHSDNTKNTHYKLGDHNSFITPSSPSEFYSSPNWKQHITHNKSTKILSYVRRKIILDPVWVQM